MNINERFPGKVLAPIEDEKIITKESASAGPVSVDGGLEQIIQKMTVRGDKDEDVFHAIPNPLANVARFIADIKEVNAKIEAEKKKELKESRKSVIAGLKEDVRARYYEWLGLSAAVALRGIYSLFGLDIRMEKVELKGENPLDCALLFAMNNMSDSYRIMIDAEKDGFPECGGLYYLKQGREYFAIYNPEIGVCPMQNYSAALFDNLVPWYERMEGESACKGWKDPLEALKDNPFALDRLKAWMRRIGFGDCVDADDAQDFLEDMFVPAGWEEAEALLGSAVQKYMDRIQDHSEGKKAILVNMKRRAENFCRVCCAYEDVNTGKHIFPQILLPQLILAQKAEGKLCGLGYNDAGGEWRELQLESDGSVTKSNLPKLDCLVPVIPFTEKAVELWGDVFEVRQMRFLAGSQMENVLENIQVQMELLLKNREELFTFTRNYPASEVMAGILPYLMVWPWVELPRDSWNLFYATQSRAKDAFRGYHKIQFAESLTLELNNCEKYEIGERSGGSRWEICCSRERFRYASVLRRNEGQKYVCGIVMIPQIGEKEDGMVEYDLGIDFGTTSTVCAIRQDGKNVEFLQCPDFCRNVTIADPRLVDEIAGRRWLGRSAVNAEDQLLSRRKTLTVAQLFAKNAQEGTVNVGQDEPFVTGRFFWASAAMLYRYTKEGNFSSWGIYNDLKLSDGTRLEEQRASTLFLAGIYMQALLFVLSRSDNKNGRIRKLHLSCPGALTMDNLKMLWNGAAELINRCLPPNSVYRLEPGKNIYYTEAEAARAYNRQKIEGTSAYVNIDIGGGTTDISIANMMDQAREVSESFKYAGREMIIETFIEIYRHWKGDREVDRRNHMKKIWGNALENLPEGMEKDLVDKFFEYCGQHRVSQAEMEKVIKDESIRMIIEILLNDFEMRLPDDNNYNLFRSIITAKFFALMRIVAEFIKKNKDALLEGCAENSDIYGNKQKVILLVFTGTASKTLQHVFNQTLDELNGLTSWKPGTRAQRMLGKLATMISEVAEIDEGVSLKLAVAEDVQEKKEVAYGLLSGDAKQISDSRYEAWDAKDIIGFVRLLDEKTLREWYMKKNCKPIPPGDCYVYLADEIENMSAEKRNAVAGELRQKANDKKVERLVSDTKADMEAFQKKIEDLQSYWEGITENKKNTTWPANAAAGMDVGFGPDQYELSDILPRGMNMRSMISRCIAEIQVDVDKCRYLTSIEKDEDREVLFMVYVVELIINKALGMKQI